MSELGNGPLIALSGPVTLKYRLIRPVIAFNIEIRDVITIPPGEMVSIAISKATVGLCSVSWNGSLVSVFREDIDRNGVVLPDEPFG